LAHKLRMCALPDTPRPARPRYNELNHARFEPGTEGRPLAYFVQTGGRFLYASAIRLAVLKAVVSLSVSARGTPFPPALDARPDTHRQEAVAAPELVVVLASMLACAHTLP